jgi:signal transduction histidine kinase
MNPHTDPNNLGQESSPGNKSIQSHNSTVSSRDIEKLIPDKVLCVKGLEAFYSIRKLLYQVADNREEALIGASVILNRAMSHPDLARSRIVLYGREYAALPVPEDASLPGISTDLIIEGQKKGGIEIFYVDDNVGFVQQESEMLNEIGLAMSQYYEGKEISKRLQETAIRLQALFNAITDTVFTIGTDFNVRISNKSMMKAGEKCYRLLYGLSEPCKGCLAHRVIQEKEIARAESIWEDKIWRHSLYPMFGQNGDNIVGVLEIIKDITQEKDLEQQLIQSDRLASLGQLVSGIAHEINNPNTFIRGNIKIVAEAMDELLPLLDKYAKRHPDFQVARLPYDFFRKNIQILISDMQHGADRIMNIVTDLRKFARKDQGLLNEEIDINNIIESSLRLVQNQIQRSAYVSLKLDQFLPAIRGNVQKLEQVVVNILINASHAIDEAHQGKKGIITVKTFSDVEENVHIHIRDDGTGMTPETRKKIFDPFFTTKRARQGTGLGLSITYGIIEEHGGNISVDTWLGKGSEFKIMLPNKAAYLARQKISQRKSGEVDM